MKCKYCGGDVTLSDHFCPHCGRPVDQAQRHQTEMRQYEAEFEETKKEAIDKIAVSSGGGTAVGIRLAVIVALIAGIVWMMVYFEPYNANERMEKRNAAKNYNEYVEQMETYLADRDYIALSVFSSQHQLDYNDDYKLYREILYGANDYKSVYKGILEAAFATKDTTNMYYASELSKNLNRFYDQIKNDSMQRYAEDPDKTAAVYSEMEEELQVLLKKYIGLTEEEAKSLRDLSRSRRTVLIEQKLDEKIVSATGKGLSQMKKEELPAIGSSQEDK